MSWQGSLALAYRHDELRGAPRTVLHDRHDGPLRVLASLYPETPAICHNVLVHPPGGLVGGDVLDIELTVDTGAHALVTTPGATRFYRSTGAPATQRLRATLATGARLEWLPLETIAYSGCLGENLMRFDLAPGAEMIGWDVLALGLPASDQAFARGRFTQYVEMPGRWLERGVIDALDTRLLDSPLGWAGHRVVPLAGAIRRHQGARGRPRRCAPPAPAVLSTEGGGFESLRTHLRTHCPSAQSPPG